MCSLKETKELFADVISVVSLSVVLPFVVICTLKTYLNPFHLFSLDVGLSASEEFFFLI
jgi:hypothetical protein